MGSLSWAGSVNRYRFMILALNCSLAAVRRDSGSAPAHRGDAKSAFLTESVQQHGEKKDVCFQHGDRDADTAADCLWLSSLFQVISSKSAQGF